MPSFQYAQKTKYRVTLELDVLNDFQPHNIDWEKLLDVQGAELSLIHISEPTRLRTNS